MVSVVKREKILKEPENVHTLIDEAVTNINQILTKDGVKFPLNVAADNLGQYGPVRIDVVLRIRDAGWMLSYRDTTDSYLIS